MWYCIPFVVIANIIFGYFAFNPRVSIIAGCKMKYNSDPVAIIEITVVYIFSFASVFIFAVLFYKLNKQKFFENDSKADNENGRIGIFGFYRKRLTLLIGAQVVRNLFYFGAWVHLPFLRVWVTILLEYLGVLTFPFEIFLFGYLQTNLLSDCCSQRHNDIGQSKEIALIGQIEEEEECEI